MATTREQYVSASEKLQKNKNQPHTLVLEHVTPATRLLEKRRQMFEVQETLEAQKREFNRKEEVFKRREDGLKKKDLELQESLVRFSKFLQENDSKRTRAEKKAEDEIRLRKQKEEEIEKLTAQLDKLTGEKRTTSDIVDKNLRYQKYLETVIDVTDEYHEITDLLMRHATLEATNDDLRQNAKLTADNVEEMQGKLQSYTKSKTDEILNLNNEISHLKKLREEKERSAQGMQTKMDSTLQNASQKTLQHGQICMATDNIFQRCAIRSKISHPKHTKPLDQLNVIGDFMGDLSAIVKTYNASGKQAKAPAAGKAATEGGGSQAEVLRLACKEL